MTLDVKQVKIALFSGKELRRTLYNGEWWFVVEDVVGVLTDSKDPKQYIKKLCDRDAELLNGWVQIVHTLFILTSGGKQKMNCANTRGLLRIIQSIPSPKAEPFKQWLAKVGYERVQEIENPELASQRMRQLYKQKGYNDVWIEKRIRGIAVREELTDEWKNRGAKESTDYQILTSEISKATFGITLHQHKQLKSLKRENLRDHMDDLELIFTMLGEKATTEIHKAEDSNGVLKLKMDAHVGGEIAGVARKTLEKKLGRSIVTDKNHIKSPQDTKKLR